MDLFEKNIAKDSPLADRMRPDNFDNFFGQKHLVGDGKLLRESIEKAEIPSMIFWGPPGSGKTTLAQIIANITKSSFIQLSAVSSGTKELREIFKDASDKKKFHEKRTILFIDAIHRWNKSQQDALLPYVEKGIVTLIGATTENPSFELNSALLSRCRVFVLELLSIHDIEAIIRRALLDKKDGLGNLQVKADDETIIFLATLSNGDARIALNILEFAVKSTKSNSFGKIVLDKKILKDSLKKSHFLYDRAGEEHYNIISALHKSIRGGNADAALYWLGRMLEAGEDPLYVARRLVRMAGEDIGLADPRALEQAIAAYQAAHYLGLPECDVALAQCAVYLARAPKSVEVYQAYQRVKQDVQQTMDAPVPLHLRNLPRLPGGKAGAPTKLMKNLGYGKNYQYSPDYDWKENQQYLPDSLADLWYIAPQNKKNP